jgi:hypothetical protein
MHIDGWASAFVPRAQRQGGPTTPCAVNGEGCARERHAQNRPPLDESRAAPAVGPQPHSSREGEGVLRLVTPTSTVGSRAARSALMPPRRCWSTARQPA